MVDYTQSNSAFLNIEVTYEIVYNDRLETIRN